MCGIAGIINFKGNDPGLARHIRQMSAAIRHRGPDGEGFAFFGEEYLTAGSDETPADVFGAKLPYSPTKRIDQVNGNYSIAFGHRRLSIIDLSPAGHQPMCSKGKDLWITYNGEIYNYIEIRQELESKGHKFSTQTDTEVILNAYVEWGEKCVDRFNGMWAFVIYDRTKNELFASRDRFGVKPFYYYHDKNVLAFASEQKALMQLPFVPKGINDTAVFDFFAKGEIEYEEEGMFKGIIELFPSHSMRVSIATGKLKKWKYYSLEVNRSRQLFSEEKFRPAAAHTEELLSRAIALRMRSDVPVGSCLSGGIDSSAIVGIMQHLREKEKMPNKLKVFTASFNEKEIDESHWAKTVVERTGAEWHQVYPSSEDLLRDLEDLIHCQDVPIWSTSTYAQYRVMQTAKEKGIKVVLDGQGGDELFAGYDTYFMARWMELLRKGRAGTMRSEMKLAGRTPTFLFKQYLRYSGLKKLPRGLRSSLSGWYYDDIQYLSPGFWSKHKQRFGTGHEPDTSSLNAMLWDEFYNTRLKGYLKCEDRCSMRHSVESRTPFADDVDLVEYVFSLPGAFKMHKGLSKYLFREAAKRYLPPAIAARTDKMGYTTPNNRWIAALKEELRPLFNESLSDFIDTKKLLKDYDRFFSPGEAVENGRIFKFISFAVWKKRFQL